MQSLSRGWSFLTQAWKMALADRDLIKPSIYNLIVGFIISLMGLVPFLFVILVFQNLSGLFARVVLGAIGIVMVFIHFSVTYIFSAMTIYLIYGYLSEGDGRMDKAWAIVQREFLNILSLAAASTAVNAVLSAVRGRSGRGGNIGRGMVADLINTVWTEATYLILPAMVIESLNLKDSLKRATQITKDNLLLVGVSTVGVNAITGMISFVLSAAGALIGFVVGYGLIAVLGTAVWALVIGIGLGIFIFMIFAMVAMVIHSYTSTAYHTCLFLWARDVERSRQTGKAGAVVAAPAPLAAVLGQLSSAVR